MSFSSFGLSATEIAFNYACLQVGAVSLLIGAGLLRRQNASAFLNNIASAPIAVKALALLLLTLLMKPFLAGWEFLVEPHYYLTNWVAGGLFFLLTSAYLFGALTALIAPDLIKKITNRHTPIFRNSLVAIMMISAILLLKPLSIHLYF